MIFLRYEMTNTEPLKITDIGMSRDGETVSVNFIPGSSVKGALINTLAADLKNKTDVFERMKKELLSCETIFCNAYITDGKRDMFPSPMGFYEDKKIVEKGEKELDNVVVRNEFRESYKRAKLGAYSFFDGNRTVFLSLKKSDSLNININQKNVFRTDYINAGYRFAGYIGFSDKVSDETKAIAEDILRNKVIRIGSSRSAGYGKMKLENISYLECGDHPFSSVSITKKQFEGNVTYMMLLSPLSMRNEFGEVCGLDIPTLEKKAGCTLKDHAVSRASASVIRMSGFNRTWKIRTPEYIMYAAGSVFRLEFDGAPDIEKLRDIEINGLGVGRNDGYGRVVFLDGYDRITSKISYRDFAGNDYEDLFETDISDENILDDDVAKDISIIAAGIADFRAEESMRKFIIRRGLEQGSASNSQTGVFRSICRKYRYSFDDAKKEFTDLFKHIREKEERNRKHSSSHGSQKKLMAQIEEIINCEDIIDYLFDIDGTENEMKFINGKSISEYISKEKQGLMRISLIEKLMIKQNRLGSKGGAGR